MKNLLLILALLLSILGCNPVNEKSKDTVPLNDKEAELFESILRAKWGDFSYDSYDKQRAYYLTCTPPSDWHSGQLKNFPDSFHRRISDMPINFKKATEAVHLGSVFFKDRKTGKSAFMVWITINKWISETEVEVEDGMWHEPLWGHGSTEIYIKVEGRVETKKDTQWLDILIEQIEQAVSVGPG